MPEKIIMQYAQSGSLEQFSHIIEHYSIDNDTLNKAFGVAAFEGHLPIIRYLVESSNILIPPLIQFDDNRALKNAAFNGYLDVVQYLLSSPELTKPGIPFADIHADNDYALRWACEGNFFEMVEFLTTSSLLKEHSHINAKNGAAFADACNSGYQKIALFLLTDPRLKENINPHLNNGLGFIAACEGGCFDVVKLLLTTENPNQRIAISNFPDLAIHAIRHPVVVQYLLSSTEIEKNVDIHESDDELFIRTCEIGDLEQVKWLYKGFTKNGEVIKANPISQNGEALKAACEDGHIEVVEFLLSTSEYQNAPDWVEIIFSSILRASKKDHKNIIEYLVKNYPVDLHMENDILFKSAWDRESSAVLDTLLYECNMEITSTMLAYAKTHPKTINVWSKRLLKDYLYTTLPTKDNQTIKKKI